MPVQDHGDELHAVPLRAGHQGVAGQGGVPGFTADDPVVVLAGVLLQHLVAAVDGEGLVVDDIEETIARVGRMGREGMRSTDEEILNMMLGN